jgi:hypothetical protein
MGFCSWPAWRSSKRVVFISLRRCYRFLPFGSKEICGKSTRFLRSTPLFETFHNKPDAKREFKYGHRHCSESRRGSALLKDTKHNRNIRGDEH